MMMATDFEMVTVTVKRTRGHSVSVAVARTRRSHCDASGPL
jgi:hypothetical protein